MRRVARALAWLVAGLVAVLGATLAFVHAPWGSARLAGLAERIASDAFDGEVRVQRLTVAPWGVHARRALILDHRNLPVIAAREVDVVLDPLALVFGRLHVERLTVRGGFVEVSGDPVLEDVGIGLAFAPEHPGPEPPKERRRPGPLPPWAPFPIELDALRLEDVAFRLAETPGAPADILVRDISARVSGAWERDARVKAELTATAVVPLVAPVAVEVQARFGNQVLEAGLVRATVGRTHVEARGLGQMRDLDAALRIEGVAGAPEARAFGIPLAGDVTVRGDFLLSRERLVGAFRARLPERGEVVGEARLSPADGTVQGRAVFRDADPGAWIVGLPAGRLSGVLAATGDLTPKPALDVELVLDPGLVAGDRVGPGRVLASLADARVRLEEARVALPGAWVSVVGSAGRGGVDLAASVKAPDLARASRFLAALGLAVPAVAGDATLHATVGGDPERPAVGLRLSASRLRVGGVRAGDLRLRGEGHLGADGLPVLELTGRAARLEAGRFRGEALRLSARRDERGSFEVRAGGGAYALDAGGSYRRDRVVVDRFAFRYPEGRLGLERPVTIETGDGRLAIRDLGLDGPGRIEGNLELRGRRLALELRADGLRLDRLPQALVPADLGGRVDLRARLAGSVQRPRGTVRFRLSDGRFGAVAGLAATGRARLEGTRAAGRIAVRLNDAGLVRGSFDLPLDPAHAPASAPVRLELESTALEASVLGRILGVELPRANLRFRLTGEGTVGGPRLRLESQALDVLLPGRVLPAADGALAMVVADGRATVKLEGRIIGRPVFRLEGEAPFEPRRFAADPAGELHQLLRSPAVRVQAEARGLDLAFVSRLLGQPEVSGPIAAVVDLRGPLLDPRGQVRVDLAARSLGAFSRVEGALAVDLGERRTSLEGRVALDNGPVSTLAGVVDASLTELLDGSAPATAPVILSVDIPELRLRRFAGGTATARAGERAAAHPGGLLKPIPSPDEPRPGPRLAGIVAGTGRFEGTLARLKGNLRLTGRNLWLGDVPLGDLELSVTQDRALEARLDAIDPTSGTLVATARIDAEVSPLGLLRDGLPAIEALPALVEVDGTALSLAPLALIDPVSAASGRAVVRLRAGGTLGRLDPRGRVEVTDGRLELAGGPVLERIELDATWEGDRIQLRRLLARAPGRGLLDARGTLDRGPGADVLAAQARVEDFPIGGPGGVTARITGNAEVQGTLGVPEGLQASVVVPELRVALPRRAPREIQPITRHRDVSVVTGPEALRRIRKSRVRQEERAIPVEVAVRAPDVRVKGEDVDARLSANLTLTRGPDAELLARGQVRSERARVQVLGRNFEVERAVARFDGPLERPTLDATARYQAREATAWVDVVGPADDPQIRLRSDPPLPESQIAVLIASGRIPEAAPAPIGAASPVGEQAPPPGGVAAGGAAASVAGSYLAGRLRQAIGPKLPLDVLVLEASREGGARIEAGTFLGERLYLGYLRDLLPEEGENLNEIRAEYELSRSFSLESFYGDAATGGVDLVFERAVPTGSQRTARREAAAAAAARPEVQPGRAPASFPGEGERRPGGKHAGEGLDVEGAGDRPGGGR